MACGVARRTLRLHVVDLLVLRHVARRQRVVGVEQHEVVAAVMMMMVMVMVMVMVMMMLYDVIM